MLRVRGVVLEKVMRGFIRGHGNSNGEGVRVAVATSSGGSLERVWFIGASVSEPPLIVETLNAGGQINRSDKMHHALVMHVMRPKLDLIMRPSYM